MPRITRRRIRPLATLAAIPIIGIGLVAAPAAAATISVPGDFPTIVSAVQAASDGDVIEIAPGTYPGPIRNSNKALTFRGTGDTPADVIVEPTPSISNLVLIEPIATGAVRIENLTITGSAPGANNRPIHVIGATTRFLRVTIRDNFADAWPIAFVFNADVAFERCLFRNNISGIFSVVQAKVDPGQRVVVEDSVLRDNEGAAILDAEEGTLIIDRSRVFGHTSVFATVLARIGGEVGIESTLFHDNVSDGAFLDSGNGPVSAVNMTAVRNTRTAGPPQIASVGLGGSLTVTNSIIGDTGDTPIDGDGAVTISSTNFAGGFEGEGNIDADPMFENAAANDFRLRPGSPCIDAGRGEAPASGVDVAGLIRLVDDRNIPDSGQGAVPFIDMGAHERPLDIRYVDDDAPAGGDGLSWATALNDVQDSFDGTGFPVAEVWIAAGTYRVDGGTGDRNRSLEMRNGLAIRGGFAGTETQRGQANRFDNRTLLTGNINAPTFSDNTRHMVRADGVDASGLLKDVTIERGNATGPVPRGGGIYVTGGAPRIQGVTVIRCSTNGEGAGVAAFDSNLELRNVRIRNHNLVQAGADSVLLLDGGQPSLVNVLVASNDLGDGPAVHIRNVESADIRQTTVAGNRGGGTTAGIRLEGSDVDIANSIFYRNAPTVAPPSDQPWIGQVSTDAGVVRAMFCTVEGWEDGAIFTVAMDCDGEDPLFESPDGPDGIPANGDDNWRLGPGSPAIDAGANSAALGIQFDLDGRARRLDDPSVPDTGDGFGPIVDRGPYEFEPVAPACPGDIDGNGEVAFDDLLEVLSAWGICPGCPADLNFDDQVTFDDLLVVLSAWGPCP